MEIKCTHRCLRVSQATNYYKPEGRGFDSRWCPMALGLTQPLTEISTRSISGGVKMAGA